jgi:hypothetical protein
MLTVFYVDSWRTPVIADATRMCEVLVGLPDVTVLGVVDRAGEPVEVVIEQRVPSRVLGAAQGVFGQQIAAGHPRVVLLVQKLVVQTGVAEAHARDHAVDAAVEHPA